VPSSTTRATPSGRRGPSCASTTSCVRSREPADDLRCRRGPRLFITEARELLESFEEGLLQLEADPDDAETINATFRSAHTLKGTSGLFGLNHLVGFAHVVETLLGHVREGWSGSRPS
jgi:HPt (histidine-containing phosphotransfer) domain-containing protein